jgi:NhaA family Na+:H+ antiporter
VEYGSYACGHCHTAHEVVRGLRDRFGPRLRYVFRHLPLTDRELATKAAELAEYTHAKTGDFWTAHEALMSRSHRFDDADLDRVAMEMGMPSRDTRRDEAGRVAHARVREDARSGLAGGARETPTFFINGRRYDGPWDESALAEALVGSLGHRLQSASLDFARWAPSTGVLLVLGTVIAVVLSNTGLGEAFHRFWELPLGVRVGERALTLPILEWVNHGLLSLFFLVVGLEIKRELTVGRLATRRAAALPIFAALGGMVMPALIYLSIAPPGPLSAGWGLTIATDTAFAVAILVLLGERVPVELRVFLTAAVIVDDLVAIAVVALFYTEELSVPYLAAAAVTAGLMVTISRLHIYRALPYALLGLVMWVLLHESGLHATLAGVVLAVVTPTRPPPNLRALVAQAQGVLQSDRAAGGEATVRHGLSEPALRALDAIHDRVDSPANKLLRTLEPWSSYFVLPVFALANAGLVWTSGILEGHGRLVMAIVLGLVVGKPAGILLAAWGAAKLGIAKKPGAYTWRHLAGAGALAGIGFTMSLFIAGEAFPEPADFTAAKVAIFMASTIAAVLGILILWPKVEPESSPMEDAPQPHGA